MLTLYRAGYSLAGITIHLTRGIKKLPSMLTRYRAGYSIAGITMQLTKGIKSIPACSHSTGLDTHSQV